MAIKTEKKGEKRVKEEETHTHRIFVGKGDVRFWGNRNLNQACRHKGTEK